MPAERLTPQTVRANAEKALQQIAFAKAIQTKAPPAVPQNAAAITLAVLAARRVQALKDAPKPWVYAAEDLLAAQCVMDSRGGMDTARAKRWLRGEGETFAPVLKTWRDGGAV